MLNNLLDWLIATVLQLDPVLLVLGGGLAIMLETSLLIGLVVPGDSVLLIAATGVTSWSVWAWLIAASIIGALLGETIGYAIGRWLGEPLKRSWLGRKIGLQNWERAETFLQHRGGVAVFVSRFLPVLHSVVPVTAGLAKMPFGKFMAWTIPASTIWSFAYVSAGALATAGYQQLSSQLSWAGYIFIGVIALFVLAVWLGKRMLTRHFSKDFETLEVSSDVAAGTEPQPLEQLVSK